MKKTDITKKISIALMAAVTALSVAGCDGDKQGEGNGTETPSSPTAVTDTPIESTETADTDTPTPEPTEAPVITAAFFNAETISEGEKVSAFTVSEIKTENGVKTVVFSGTLTVNGLLSDNGDGTCSFKYTEEYAPYLPTPVGGIQKKGSITVDANSAIEILGAKEGAFSITVRDYTLTVSEEITESVTEFEKQEGDYGIIG